MVRLTSQTVLRLHQVLQGDPLLENYILAFIAHRYSARNLFHLRPHVATEILKRPQDFILAVKHHFEPELSF